MPRTTAGGQNRRGQRVAGRVDDGAHRDERQAALRGDAGNADALHIDGYRARIAKSRGFIADSVDRP